MRLLASCAYRVCRLSVSRLVRLSSVCLASCASRVLCVSRLVRLASCASRVSHLSVSRLVRLASCASRVLCVSRLVRLASCASRVSHLSRVGRLVSRLASVSRLSPCECLRELAHFMSVVIQRVQRFRID